MDSDDRISRQTFATAVQATAYLLKRFGGRADRMKVLRLLYLADRESIRVSGCAISGDEFVSTEGGTPIASDVARMMEIDFWKRYVVLEGTELVLVADPGDGFMSEHSEEVLGAVELGVECPESGEPGETITEEKLLRTIHPDWSDEVLKAVLERNQYHRDVRQSFGPWIL